MATVMLDDGSKLEVSDRELQAGVVDLDSKNGNGEVAVADPPRRGRPPKNRLAKPVKIDEGIPPVHGALLFITVRGVSQLVMNQMSAKTLDKLVGGQVGEKLTGPKVKRDVKAEFAESLHTIKSGTMCGNKPFDPKVEADRVSLYMKNGIYGAPPQWFKHAMCSATSLLDKMRTRFIRTGVWVRGGNNPKGLLPIVDEKGKPIQPTIHEGWVRTQGARPVAMVRWRGQFQPGWLVEIPVLIVDTSQASPQDMPNLLDHAGLKCGVGEGRPSKTPALGWGLFKVVKVRAATRIEMREAGLELKMA